MIAERQSKNGFVPAESLPATVRSRLYKVLKLLTEASCYAACERPTDECGPVAYRLRELFQTGMTSLDCRWLSAGGYIAPLPDGLRGRRISADPWLDEKMFVMLTDSGETLLALLEDAGETSTTSRDLVDRQRLGGDNAAPTIRYDSQTSELFLDETRLFRLPTNALNMGIILERFEKLAWRSHRIPNPFANRGHRKRSQAARDAIHGLKQRQNPVVIEFHTSQKGATIWYELLLENLPRGAATRKAPRLPR